MVLAQPVVLPQQCPRCAGLRYCENDEAWCLYCGERVFATRPLVEPTVSVGLTRDGLRKRGRPRKVRCEVA
jgi:hypothetical protein